MIKYDEREVRQPKVVRRMLVAATCDRCGQDALCQNSSVPSRRGGGSFGGMGPWGEAELLIQGGEVGSVDLCGRCVEEFIEWVEAGDGPGVQRSPG